MQLVLLSEQGTTLREKSIPAPAQPGVFAIPLPESLQPGQRYQWSLAVMPVCDLTKLRIISGWVERRSLPVAETQRLQRLKPTEQIQFYARRGLWYDTLNAMAQRRQAQPHDSQWQEDWVRLLQAIQLPRYADAPIVTTQDAMMPIQKP